MRPHASKYNAQMIGVAGHLHDVSENVNVYINDKVICDSKAIYGTSVADWDSANSNSTSAPPTNRYTLSKRHEDPMDGMPHIVRMSFCRNIGALKQGETIRVDANL
ncbi:hypothetical protein K402DRAFT_460864 [Aulographum hederae CBS 113979]|uniref:Uncharacterized protein n=1 Tax=Aulographum hederae CBS 113979 TaxID=1176131 RepID=A0A6G1HAS8_9PEZI|nr:hypothetical protein K402DRAFT_460864 [Aulographum hederae CBS 113979]